ncbi:MAG: PLDc N-terminal domain-containing protein, partial [Gammaproteobacteria bacterium]
MLDFFRNYWPYILVAADLLLVVGVTLDAVLRKRDTRAVIGWVGLAWLAPIIGPLAYILFGINRIQRKASQLEIGEGLPAEAQLPLTESDYQIRDTLLARCPNLRGLASLGTAVTGNQILPGNSAELLIDGDAAYPAMLEAIGAAKVSISLLSYIFDSDRVGEQFLQALKQAT